MIVIYQDYSIDGENWLFPDAKILKNVPQDFISGNFADDGADVVEGFAEVLGEEVGGEGVGEAGADADEGVAGVGKGLVVADVGDEDGVGIGDEAALGGDEGGFQGVKAFAGLGGNGDDGDGRDGSGFGNRFDRMIFAEEFNIMILNK